MAAPKTTKKKKKDIRLSEWILYVNTSRNNTIVTLTTTSWAVVIWSWTGVLGFKGSKKSTPFAAEELTKSILKEAKWYGLETIGIVFKGTGIARDGVFKAIHETWLVEIMYIKEHTPIQFGGCKRPRPKHN